jgi:tRNA-splicing ligase RtcB (3'-phosphate/5'-hydroxy nucleic acid ligase)
MATQETQYNSMIQPTGEATAIVEMPGAMSPIQIIGTEAIRKTFDEGCLQQAINSRQAPGVSQVVLNPDAHLGYGAPVGCVMVSPTHVYPGPVGVDIKCSMSLLQTTLPASEIETPQVRRELIRAILDRIPTGPGRGQRDVPKSRHVDERLGFDVSIEGASKNVLGRLGIPSAWAERCEDAFHRAPDNSTDSLAMRLIRHQLNKTLANFANKCTQLGSYGGGNHFGECEVVDVRPDARSQQIAEHFGLVHGKVAFLSHCGSRGLGHSLAMGQFQTLSDKFRKSGTAFPAGDAQLVYAEVGSQEAFDYLCDMAIGANFATVNHLLINALVLDAFEQVFPGVRGELVYFISHNIAKQERVDGQMQWVHRKGATRAFPAGHAELAGTLFADTGHPILLPGNPVDGSAVMVASAGAAKSCFSVNHGAGRMMSRNAAKKKLDQTAIDNDFREADILSNCRFYPKDEAPGAYKDFNEVLKSVELADLAHEVARLRARFVIKDGGPADD